jgi:clan AA aspartic protease
LIVGEVTADREAVLPLELRGPSGLYANIDAAVDTGFTDFLLIPESLAAELDLRFRESAQFNFADGSVADFDIYEVVVMWDGHERDILTAAGEGGPLVGMALLYGSCVTLNVVDGGRVTVETLP